MDKNALQMSTDVIKKYCPREIKPSNLYLFMADTKIRMLAANAKMVGCSDEEIIKLIQPSVDKMIKTYTQIQQKEGTRE